MFLETYHKRNNAQLHYTDSSTRVLIFQNELLRCATIKIYAQLTTYM